MEQAAEAAAVRPRHEGCRSDRARIVRFGSGAQSVTAIRSPSGEKRHQAGARLRLMEAHIAALAKLGLSRSACFAPASAAHGILYRLRFQLWSRDAERPVQVAGGGRTTRCSARWGRRGTFRRARLRHPQRARAGGAPRHGGALTGHSASDPRNSFQGPAQEQVTHILRCRVILKQVTAPRLSRDNRRRAGIDVS